MSDCDFEAVRDYGRRHLGWDAPVPRHVVEVETIDGDWVPVIYYQGRTETKRRAKDMARTLNLIATDGSYKWARVRKART